MREIDHSVLTSPARVAAVKRIAGQHGQVRDAVQAMLHATAVMLNARTVSVTLVDADHETAWATNAPHHHARTQPLPHALGALVVATAQQLAIPDITTDASTAAARLDLEHLATDQAVTSYLGTPLTVENGLCVGSLCAYRRDTQTWSPPQREALTHITRAVALLLTAPADPDAATQRIAEHAALRRVATTAAFADDTTSVLETALTELTELLHAPVALHREPDPHATPQPAGAPAGHEPRRHPTAHDPTTSDPRIGVPIVIADTTWGTLVTADSPMPAHHARTLAEPFAELIALAVQRDQRRQRLAEQALTDPLSGVANRRAIDAELRHRFAALRRTGTPFAVILLDVDHFKTINDTHGHSTGDTVLRHVAACLQAATREHELVGRIGGDEYCVVLDGDEHHASSVADRLRTTIEHHTNVTVSIGICDAPHAPDPNALLDCADRGLYAAKAAGRNTIRTAD